MSDEIRKDGASVENTGGAAPRDDEVFTPQGGGGGTGAAPLGPPPSEGDEAQTLTLPQVGPDAGSEGAGPEAAEEEKSVSSFRLVMTLAVAGAVAGALLVFVYLWSNPLIEAENARVLQEAVGEVLKGPERFESIFIEDGELKTAAELTAGADTMALEKVFLGYDQAGEPIGFAMTHRGFGFQDLISVIFGYDAGSQEVLGMKVLNHAETPGLGNKIEEMPFVGEFDGTAASYEAEAPLDGVKPDRNTGAANQVDLITGVTISSRAVVRIINERIAELGALLAAYEPTGGQPAAVGSVEPGSGDGASGAASGNAGGEEEDR